MSEQEIRATILLEEEPMERVLVKWLAWMLVMIVFVMLLIYFSDYFGDSRECFSDIPIGIPSHDLRIARWMHDTGRYRSAYNE